MPECDGNPPEDGVELNFFPLSRPGGQNRRHLSTAQKRILADGHRGCYETNFTATWANNKVPIKEAETTWSVRNFREYKCKTPGD